MLRPLSSNYDRQAVLIIGATGRVGKEVIQQLADHPSCPDIHAFCHDATKLSDSEYDSCCSVIEGSARHAIDIEEALSGTNANWVVLCVGSGDDLTPNNIRTRASQNLVRVLQQRQFLHVRVLAVSMSRNHRFIGKRNRIRYHCVLEDHKGQEAALRELGRRAIIVRPTIFDKNEKSNKDSANNSLHRRGDSLSSSIDSSISSTSSEMNDMSSSSSSSYSSLGSTSFTQITTFGDGEYPSSRLTRRSDLADWIIQQICDVSSYEHHIASHPFLVVNVTSVKAVS